MRPPRPVLKPEMSVRATDMPMPTTGGAPAANPGACSIGSQVLWCGYTRKPERGRKQVDEIFPK
jgi:hypothetical protein